MSSYTVASLSVSTSFSCRVRPLCLLELDSQSLGINHLYIVWSRVGSCRAFTLKGSSFRSHSDSFRARTRLWRWYSSGFSFVFLIFFVENDACFSGTYNSWGPSFNQAVVSVSSADFLGLFCFGNHHDYLLGLNRVELLRLRSRIKHLWPSLFRLLDHQVVKLVRLSLSFFLLLRSQHT